MQKPKARSKKSVAWITVVVLFVTMFYGSCVAVQKRESKELQWPVAVPQNHPWSRWWWLGSAVDEQNLTRLLTQYQEAGIGGVEICPIYGARGYEEQFKDFLSPEWKAVLEHTLREGKRLNIGVDLTMGSGWPFGGPMVTESNASSGVVFKKLTFQNGTVSEPLPREPLQYLVAVSDDGRRIDVTEKVHQQHLEWTPPKGTWTLYAVAVKSPMQKVKRAGPGGQGYVLDPYSTDAMDFYLNVFDGVFEGYTGPMPRAFFHDSFEYYGATWTKDLFDEFKSRRGYDLRSHIEALFGDGPDEVVARVMCDYHETINDLHIDYMRRWTQWCHTKGSLSRNQAHGAPANLLDLYAASDIPETEIFQAVNEAQIPMLKLSSSAAHLTGQPLASSESFTWLKEHFQTSLSDLKNATDFLFLTGVNHIFFHGIPYSPEDAPWPGWQFYASVNFAPSGGLWHDLPAFNAYVTRCQSILQSGKPDNDVLVYLPMYDFWHKKSPLEMTFTVHNQNQWLYPSSFYSTAMDLWKKGYTYDTVSDQFLSNVSCKDGKVSISQNEYALVIVPKCHLIPLETVKNLLELAQTGATILFQDSIPQDVPGFADLESRRKSLHEMLSSKIPGLDDINAGTDNLTETYQEFPVGKGKVILSDLESSLKKRSVPRESAMDSGIRFVRRQSKKGYDYFFVNRSTDTFDGWMALGKPAQSAVLMDPLYEDRTGQAALKQVENLPQVYLQLCPGQSMILRTYAAQNDFGQLWQYCEPAGDTSHIEGPWDIEFIEGGPVLPAGQKLNELSSWTTFDDETARFYGTARYTTTFEAPEDEADDWLLDLGRVCNSARVTLNGVPLGTLWAEPFQLQVGSYLTPGKNTLEVDVTNPAANRVRDMDRRGVDWKYFYDINVVDLNYRPLDASNWPLFDSGLLGPVQLYPQKHLNVEEIPEVHSTPEQSAESLSWKYDFGTDSVAKGYIPVNAKTLYTSQKGYGFLDGAEVTTGRRELSDPLENGFCSSTKPFFFMMDVPEEGNYRVKLALGGNLKSENTVKAESRRLMLKKVETSPDTTQTRTIIVNIRNSDLPGGKSVRLKDREQGVFHWDNSLTLEFNGVNPSVCAIEIEKADDIPTIFLAGDSTVTDQTQEPWTSWGQMLTRFFKPDIAIANYAESGETLRAFVGERRLEKILTQIKAGDYLFIQFAHNDMKRGTPEEIGYQESLMQFVESARKNNAYPVLVTSMHRRRFDEDGNVVDTMQGFPEAMKTFAQEQNVPLIDLHAMSRDFYEAMGPEKSAGAFVDGTHHNAYGAYELAKCIIKGIRANVPALDPHIVDDYLPFDPSKPDPMDEFNIPASPMSTTIKPEGN